MSEHWICAKCDQPILKSQPFTRAIVPGRSPKPGVVSGKVLGVPFEVVPIDIPVLLEAPKGLTQHSRCALAVRTTREFHHRFIVLDNASCRHVGCSIKDAGRHAFMLSEIEDEENRRGNVGAAQRVVDHQDASLVSRSEAQPSLARGHPRSALPWLKSRARTHRHQTPLEQLDDLYPHLAHIYTVIHRSGIARRDAVSRVAVAKSGGLLTQREHLTQKLTHLTGSRAPGAACAGI